MCMIIIDVFQMDNNCILIKYYFMFKIIIHVFQMDINCVPRLCIVSFNENLRLEDIAKARTL